MSTKRLARSVGESWNCIKLKPHTSWTFQELWLFGNALWHADRYNTHIMSKIIPLVRCTTSNNLYLLSCSKYAVCWLIRTIVTQNVWKVIGILMTERQTFPYPSFNHIKYRYRFHASCQSSCEYTVIVIDVRIIDCWQCHIWR